MELKNFISSCRTPGYVSRDGHRVVHTRNKNGDTVFSSCGRCPDCLNKKSVKLTNMTMNASQEFKYTYMVTLKYDEINVPRMQLLEKDGIIYCKDITKRR